MPRQSGPKSNFRCKLLIINRITPCPDSQNHFKTFQIISKSSAGVQPRPLDAHYPPDCTIRLVLEKIPRQSRVTSEFVSGVLRLVRHDDIPSAILQLLVANGLLLRSFLHKGGRASLALHVAVG